MQCECTVTAFFVVVISGCVFVIALAMVIRDEIDNFRDHRCGMVILEVHEPIITVNLDGSEHAF